MNCAACGTENDASRKFCMECGGPLERGCPVCGAPNPAPSKFCGECGAALGGAAPPEAPATPATATERRLVSVLFLDLVSFTTLSEQRDAEDMRELLSSYFDTARTVIERHGGVVEKFIGDAVMAVWGTPVTHEDDAERAVRAGLELVDAVDALGRTVDAPLRARGGVLTGEAATMPGGEREGMVTGDMVNTASRLQSAAEPGQVFVGDATVRAASRSVVFEEVGELALKGKEEPVRAWRALRVVADRSGSAAIEPPFVGRAEQLRLLKELLHATGREGKVRVVSVTGIGGIGKSRLAYELLKYVEGLSETFYWHQGRCPAYGDGITFWALGEMVRMRARIAETDAPAISRAKLTEAVATYLPEDERRWVEPGLAFLLGLGERPAGGREELFAAWRTFFERISEVGTVAMVFEDLQWADEGLLDFIESLLEWSRNRPILVVTLARPELVDRRPNWGAGQRNFMAQHLEPLPDEAMRELVTTLIPDAGAEPVARIVERAEGVPLYAVETIRMLADRGVLRAGDTAYELAGDLGELHVPETLHALIASRLDTLAPEDRALLQAAAVLGKSFTLASLAAVSGADVDTIEPRLSDLARREFLLFEADPRSPERGQYAFVQGLIREVAYGMLSKADRRRLHLAAAHHFEAVTDDELAGVVASHYLEALRATSEGSDADALAARTRDWLGQAAERATELGSPRQALGFATQALEITPAGRERVALLERAAAAAGDALLGDDWVAYLEEAVSILHDLDDRDAEVLMMGQLVDALADADLNTEVAALAERMRERLGSESDPLAWAEYHRATMFVQFVDGTMPGSLSAIESALDGFDRWGEMSRFLTVMGEKAYVLGNLGRHREADVITRGRLAIASEQNDLRAITGALMALGNLSSEPRLGLDRNLEAAEVARKGGYGPQEMLARANALEFAVENGEWRIADDMITDLRARPDLPVALRDAVSLGVALLAAYRGQEADARAAIESVSTEVTEATFATLRAWYLRISAVVEGMAGDLVRGFSEAMASIEAEPEGMNAPLGVWCAGRTALWAGRADDARRPLDLSPAREGRWVGDTRRAIEAGIDALEGHPREAAAVYEAVLASRLAEGDRFTHALTVVDAVSVLPPEFVPEGAVETARPYLEELGAIPLLARLPLVDAHTA